MSDDRLTPHERAVIEAAGRIVRTPWATSDKASLIEAVDAYRKATAPPEPFEAYAGYYDDGVVVVNPRPQGGAFKVWRCTVTPTERVQ